MDPSVVLGPIVDKPVGSLYSYIKRQFAYVRRWRENIQDLQQKAEALNIAIGNIQRKISEAETFGDIIVDNASDWLRDANRAKADAETFLNEKLNADERCLKGMCPNICSRYLVSRDVKKKTAVIVQLNESGNMFQTVSQPAPLPSFESRFGSSDFEAFESRNPVFEELMNALKDEEIHVIGIYGMGGVGKTTMVVEAGAQAEKAHVFDKVIKVVISQNLNIGKVQDEIAAQLNLKLDDEATEVGKAGRLLHRLKNGKKILLILDDVWKEFNLKEIGIPSDGMKDCKIIVTTRNESLRLVDKKINKKIPIGVLSDNEAWILFRRQVEDTIPPGMHEVAKQVCKECAGLPVSILAIGRTLMDKSSFEWADVLEQLRNSQLNNIDGVAEKVYASLLVSYNNLGLEDAKACFLFCCLFPEDFDISIETILRYGSGVGVPSEMDTLGGKRNRVRYLVNHLKRNCLLLEGRDEEHVKMHDVVRDVAISIVSEGQRVFLSKTGGDIKEWPKPKRETYDCCTAISVEFDEGNCPEFPNGMKCPKLNTLLLSSFSRKWEIRRQPLKIPQSFFFGVINLKVLVLTEVKILELPPSIESLVDLRVLSLEACELGELSRVGKLKKLEMLILTKSNFDLLPAEIGDLSHLRLLDLSHCYKLKCISPGVIVRLSRLEELFLLPYTEVNLAELKSLYGLKALEMYVRPKFETLPSELVHSFWANLTNFNISINESPLWFKSVLCKNALNLNGVSLTGWEVVLLKRVEVLHINKLNASENLKLYEDDPGCFSNLVHFEASSCHGMQEIVTMVVERSAAQLRVLKIEDCCLEYLFFPSMGNDLVHLEYLDVKIDQNVDWLAWVLAVIGRVGYWYYLFIYFADWISEAEGAVAGEDGERGRDMEGGQPPTTTA